jgi:hypothetical protein
MWPDIDRSAPDSIIDMRGYRSRRHRSKLRCVQTSITTASEPPSMCPDIDHDVILVANHVLDMIRDACDATNDVIRVNRDMPSYRSQPSGPVIDMRGYRTRGHRSRFRYAPTSMARSSKQPAICLDIDHDLILVVNHVLDMIRHVGDATNDVIRVNGDIPGYRSQPSGNHDRHEGHRIRGIEAGSDMPRHRSRCHQSRLRYAPTSITTSFLS